MDGVREPRRSGRCRRGFVPWVGGLFQLIVALLGIAVSAVELRSGPSVVVGTNDATLQWTTDVPAGGRVQWGTHPGRLDRRTQGPTGTHHSVTLDGLRPGTTYHFTVGTARYPLATNQFTTQGTTSAAPLASPATGSAPSTPGPAGSAGAGGSVGSPASLPQAPPARATWGSLKTLQDHFDRHGKDFGATDPEDYARQAWGFLQRARREGLPAKRDSEGVLRVYDPATRAFGAYNRDGTTRTYFKPGRRDYFQDQPGRPVNLKTER